MIRVNHIEFYKAVNLACKVSSRIKDMLTIYKLDDYKAFKCYLSDDGVSGYAINNGELISVFSLFKGQGNMLVSDAIRNGAYKLDCFDGYLTGFYQSMGFVITKREANWTQGQPDVIYMSLKKGRV